MDQAAANGHLEVVKWLHENRKEGCTTKAMDEAVAYGHLEVIKWLHENRSEGCTAEAINIATRNCHLELIDWLAENYKFAPRVKVVYQLFIRRQMRTINLLIERGMVNVLSMIYYAAKKGNLSALEWFGRLYSGMVSTTMQQSTSGASPRDVFLEARTKAANKNHSKIVQWIDDHLLNE